MSNASLEDDLYPPPEPSPPPRKGVAWLAWVVILLAVGLVVSGENLQPEPAAEEEKKSQASSLVFIKIQARYIVGAANMVENQATGLYEQAQAFNQGPPLQRLTFVVLAGELKGAKEALLQLRALQADMAAFPKEVSQEERRLADILDRLYQDYAAMNWEAPSLDDQDRHFLRQKLDWFGELALTPKAPLSPEAVMAIMGIAPWFDLEAQNKRTPVLEPAKRTAGVMLGGVLCGMLVAFLGLVGLILLLIFAGQGYLQSGIQTGLPHAGVYAETFAWWLVLYLGFSAGSRMLPGDHSLLVRSGLAMLASLVVLVWPRLRGISWSQMRQDIGWTWGRQPLAEPFLGVATYGMSLPLLAVGLVLTLILMLVKAHLPLEGGDDAASPFAGSGSPITPHPVIGFLVEGDWLVWLQVIFLASVVAPLVEETMFRGVLYRHLREATRWASPFWSILFSALWNSFLFAVIHPTGIVAVPLLMALALGFSLAREWRGTLIPSMVAHGLSNGLVTLLVISIMGK